MKFICSEKLAFPVAILGLVFSVFLHYERSLDWALQKIFFQNGSWLVDENEPIGKIFFYNLPKVLLIVYGAFVCGALLMDWRAGRYSQCWKRVRLLICLGMIPLIISLFKEWTNEPCPREFSSFGGILLVPNQGNCFPGGHASGGYALLALYWYWGKSRWGTLIGFLAGGLMGAYQMAKGAHFLSDTLVTAFFAWTFCWIVFNFQKENLC